MFTGKSQSIRIFSALTFLVAAGLVLPASGVKASIMDSIGDGASGSYEYSAPAKSEGSGGMKMPPGMMKQKPRMRKGEGSGGMKMRPPAGHGYPGSRSFHGKREGSGGKTYSHGGKPGYTHGKREGSGGKRYGHGGGGYGGHKISPFKHLLCLRKKLGLTDDQVAEINRLDFEYRKNRIRSRAEHEIAHMELDRLVHSGEVDENRMRALADRISQIKSGKIHAMVEAKIALLKLLTPEQRKKVKALHAGH